MQQRQSQDDWHAGWRRDNGFVDRVVIVRLALALAPFWFWVWMERRGQSRGWEYGVLLDW